MLSRKSFVRRVCLIVAVAGVSLFGNVALANRDAADTTNALDLKPGGGKGYSLTGTGVKVGVFEANGLFRTTHEAFRNADGTSRAIGMVSTSYTSHGTSVAGTIGGNAVGGSNYEGMAPGVTLYSYGTAFQTAMGTTTGKSLDISNHSYSAGYDDGWSDQTWTINGVSLQYHTWFYGTVSSGTYGVTRVFRDVYATNPRYGRYDSNSRYVDTILHDNPRLLSFWSAGNSRNPYTDYQDDNKYVAQFSAGVTPVNGVRVDSAAGTNYWLVSTADYPAPGGSYDTVSGYGAAKNSIVVGAISDYTTDPHPARITTSSTLTASFSNYGPTDDGRLGVTLVANGVSLKTPSADSDTSYSSGISGTSFSSPNAAGTAALLLEHWRAKTDGYTPLASTQKALLIHTASDLVSGGQIGPDYRTGYGLINGLKAAQFIDGSNQFGMRRHHWIERTISPGQELVYTFTSVGLTATTEGSTVTDLGGIRATLVWTDPEGNTASTASYNDRTFRALVNDLDLWITDAGGNTYYPWTLDPNNPTAAAIRTMRNDVDNIEQVFIEAGVLGSGSVFQLHVGIDGGLLGNQAQMFSLLVSGATLGFVPVPEPMGVGVVLGGGIFVMGRRRGGRMGGRLG